MEHLSSFFFCVSVDWRGACISGERKHWGLSGVHQKTLTKPSPEPLLSHGKLTKKKLWKQFSVLHLLFDWNDLLVRCWATLVQTQIKGTLNFADTHYPPLSSLQCGLNLAKKSLKVTQDTKSLSPDANESWYKINFASIMIIMKNNFTQS